jgi:hypothetical protein
MSEEKYVCSECGNVCHNSPESTCDKCLDAPEARIETLEAQVKELKEKLSLYEWRDIKDAKKSRTPILLGWWANDYTGKTVWVEDHGFWNFKYDAPMHELHECCEDHEDPSACDKDENGECYCKEGWYRYTDNSEEYIEPIPATHYCLVPTPPSTQEGEE